MYFLNVSQIDLYVLGENINPGNIKKEENMKIKQKIEYELFLLFEKHFNVKSNF